MRLQSLPAAARHRQGLLQGVMANCPRCFGRSMVPRRVLNTQDVVMTPCPNANCFGGQVSCSEGAERLGQIGKPLADYHVRGGLARAAAMTPEARSEQASRAARARWAS